jgi:dTDP-4-amino-4,6-dideoxygalactose transaminase
VGVLGGSGVPVAVGSCSEIHRERAFPEAWRPARPLPVAAELGRSSLAMLCHPTLDETDIDAMADATIAVLRAATR